ncbi:hypothetical protein DITRI_Ditri12bG0086400 [Diplodiscus trichospermus]
MAAQKLNHSLETMQQNNDSWEDFGDEGNEETLSLCDLVVSSTDANEYFCKDHRSNDGDYFEFSSEDFIYPENYNNIIFCGKLISRKENQPFEDTPQSLKSKVKQENDGKKNIRGCCMFPWKTSHSFNKSRTFPSSPSPPKESQGRSLNKSLSLPATGYGNSDVCVIKKVSVKSRWYLFAFGIGKFPMEIELKDMKMRQSRKSVAMKFHVPDVTEPENIKAMKFHVPDVTEPENIKGDKGERKTAKGLWRLLKLLGVTRKGCL